MRRARQLVAAACCLTLLAGTARGAEDTYIALNIGLGIHYLVPGYEALAASADQQLAKLENFCEAPDERGLEASRGAFHNAMDAWMRVQHIRSGPISKGFRAERINHWPERRQAVARTLDALMVRRDPAALDKEAFARSSVAGQGLSALERLLFTPGALAALTAGDPAAQYRCALVLAIGRNVADIAGATAREWRGDVLPTLGQGGGSTYFYSPRNAAKQLLEDLAHLLQVAADLKLEPVLGPGLETARPDLAENRLSGRSVRNLVLNLRSAEAMYGDTGSRHASFSALVTTQAGGAALDARMHSLFAAAVAAAQAIPAPLDQAVVEPGAGAYRQVETLRNTFREEVPDAVGITLGYTSLGD
jgi:predicted lipoprotein